MFRSINLLQAIFLWFFLPFIFSACSKNAAELEKLNWLNGNWENENEGVKTVEIWKQKPDGSYMVRGFMLEKNDTLFSEKITVSSKQGQIIYTVTIADQNNGEPVPFKLTQNTGKLAVFENPEHDFPQQIRYESKSPNTVLVQISGLVKNETKKQEYYLYRNKN